MERHGYITASYNWRRLIFLNANARVDGSNSFGDRANDKLLPIWSVSASFDAAQLDFFKQFTWLDYFSVKGSWGYQGNMLSSQSPVLIIKKKVAVTRGDGQWQSKWNLFPFNQTEIMKSGGAITQNPGW